MKLRKPTIKTIKTRCVVCSASAYSVLTTGKDYEYNTCNNTFKIVQCTKCSHVYLNPKPPLTEFDTIYPDDYYSYDFLNEKGISLARLGKEIIEKKYIDIYKNLVGKRGSILDVGCGDGRLLALLGSAKDCNWKLYGLDFNAKGNSIARNKGLTIYQGKFEDVRLQAGSFDLVIMNEVFEHLYRPNASLLKVRRILKRGGWFVIETPCVGSWDYRLFKKHYWGGYHIPRHLNIFSRETIRRILKKAGFEVVSEQSLLSPPFWILSVHNMLYANNINKRIVKSFNFYNPFLLAIGSIIDTVQMRFGPTSTMRIIARAK